MLTIFGTVLGIFIAYELFHIFMMLLLSSTPYEKVEKFIQSHFGVPWILKIIAAILMGIIIGPFMWEYKYHIDEPNFQDRKTLSSKKW